MNEKQRIKTSKFLSLVLRHEPECIGLTLDPAGWVEVNALLAALRQYGRGITRSELEEIVATNEKKRFAFSESGTRIRASQGHSVEVELGYTPQVPPAELFHGTATRFIGAICAEGLRRGSRQHVHLSAELDTAVKVGTRHGKPAVFVVHAAAMHAAGHAFFLSENGVWLAEAVPAEFLELRESEPLRSYSSGPGKKSSRASMAEETVRICDTGEYTAHDGTNIRLREDIATAVAGTVLHDLATDAPVTIPNHETPARLSVTAETTLAALRRLSATPGGLVAGLNFASAKNPGGGFLGGAEAQEESLARSSALYPCLLAAPEYYQRNRTCRTTLYLDLAIWSPAVPFFRDDAGDLLAQPFTASVITAPAPNAGAVANNESERIGEIAPTLRRRADFVLRMAIAHGVRRLVLGAWGCGVFRNDPRQVARVFAHLVGPAGPYHHAFEEIVFAIYSKDEMMHRAFTDALAGSAAPSMA